LFSHLAGTRNFVPLESVRRIGDFGNLGVRVFFVISGFLITTLLLAELDKAGRIDFKAFYLRRAFRIFPAFYVYLGAVGLLSLASAIPVPGTDLALAAGYATNFVSERSWLVGHVWSLSVEEQFYLLWPLGLWAARSTKGLYIAVFVLAVAPFFRIGMWTF